MSKRDEQQTILSRLRHHADRKPDGVIYRFLRERDAEVAETRTYRQLLRRVTGLATVLRTQFNRGDRALLLYRPGLEFIEAFLACLATGIVAVPAYPPKRTRSIERLQAILADAAPSAVLTTEDACHSVERGMQPFASNLPCIATDRVAEADEGPSLFDVGYDDIAFLQYTSGSTGSPRGVVVRHRNMISNMTMIQDRLGYTDETVSVSWLPVFHDMGLFCGVLQPLFTGYSSILMSPTTFLQSPSFWLQTIQQYQATTSCAPNFAYDFCVRSIPPEDRRRLSLSSLKTLCNGAEPIRSSTLERFAEAFYEAGIRPEMFFPCYGLAEATVFVTGGPRHRVAPSLCVQRSALELQRRIVPANSDPLQSTTLVSSGQPAAGIQVRIVDPDTGIPCAEDTIGEIWVAGESVTRGYWRHHENQTDSRFRSRLPGDDTLSFLRTGDLGALVHGELFVTGRIKDLIIIRGRNIAPQDLETSIEQVLPFVSENAVAAFSLDGEATEGLGICIEANREFLQECREFSQPHGSPGVSPLEKLFQRVREVIAEQFEVAVQQIAVLHPGGLPRTSSGKVQRHACRSGLSDQSLKIIHQWPATSLPQKSPTVTAPDCVKEGPACPLMKESDSNRIATNLIEWLREYGEHRLNSRMMDERRCVPPSVVLDFGNQGLFGLQVPRRYGGLELTSRDTLRIYEQIAAIDLTLGTMLGIHNGLGVHPVLHFGNEQLQSKWLPAFASGRQLAAFALTEPGAGSDPNAIQSQARRTATGWNLTGEKQWIGLGSWSGAMTVIARAHDHDGQSSGTVALLVPGDTRGLRHGPEALTMGVRAIVQNTIFLENAAVDHHQLLGRVGQGLEVAQDAMMFCRAGVAAASLGAMKRCAQLIERYAGRRTIGTGRLLENPVCLFRLDEILSAIEVTEALLDIVGDCAQAGTNLPVELGIACKTSAPEFLGSAVDQLMQLLGGRGYIESNGVPQLYRDARLLRIFEGPTETLLTFLGSRVLQQSHQIDALLRETFSNPQIAQSVATTVAMIRDRLGTSFPTATANSQRVWLCYRLGEWATAVILCAAAEHGARSGRIAANSLEWARQRSTTLRERLHAHITPWTLQAATISNRVAVLRNSIGDVEQRLPGEEVELDPFLRRDQQGSRHPQRRFEPVVNASIVPPRTVTPLIAVRGQTAAANPEAISLIDTAGLVRSRILEWLRTEVAPDLSEFDVDASFLSLGVDSVGAAAIALKLEQDTGVRLSPEILFDNPTIRELTAFIDRQHTTSSMRTAPATSAFAPTVAPPGMDRHLALSPANPSRRSFSTGFPESWREANRRFHNMQSKGQYFYEVPFNRHQGTESDIHSEPQVMLAGFGYLGLVAHPEVNQAAQAAIAQYGAGCHGTRLLAGTLDLHHQLEARLAAFVNAEAAAIFSSGFLTNVAAIVTLVGTGDVVIGDEWNHASIVDGCKFSGAEFLTFRHNNLNDLEACLNKAAGRRTLVVVDGVYSMEGDIAPIPQIVQLCRQFQAILMVDEAHSLGVLGNTGRGVQEHFQLPSDAIDVKMGTLSKSFGSVGGFIAGSAELITYLKHQGRGYMFSTASPAPNIAAVLKALEILEREPERVTRLRQNARHLVNGLTAAGFRIAPTESPIVPLLCDTEEEAFRLTAHCRDQGVFVIPIIYPAVPMNAPRLRLCVMASHTEEDINRAIQVIINAGTKSS